MPLLIIGSIFLIIGIVLFYKAYQIKINKNIQQQEYLSNLKNQVHLLEANKNNLIHSQVRKKEQLHKEYLQYKEYLQKERQNFLIQQQENINLKIQKAEKQSQKIIEDIHLDTQKIRQSAKQQKEQIINELNQLKASLNAGVEARLREQQKQEQLDFYKLHIDKADLSDVQMLENLKASFHRPVVLSKLIWSQYFQKQMTELCDRVLGKQVVCGIYKITNLLTEQCYIGQSVNISNRWKEHCKCGLGIDASSTNILYNSMQKDKVWNFTFELLEQCPKENLNEKEAFWIEMYQSNNFGFNATKGMKV